MGGPLDRTVSQGLVGWRGPGAAALLALLVAFPLCELNGVRQRPPLCAACSAATAALRYLRLVASSSYGLLLQRRLLRMRLAAAAAASRPHATATSATHRRGAAPAPKVHKGKMCSSWPATTCAPKSLPTGRITCIRRTCRAWRTMDSSSAACMSSRHFVLHPGQSCCEYKDVHSPYTFIRFGFIHWMLLQDRAKARHKPCLDHRAVLSRHDGR
jgi:hypothetical protein